MKKRNLSESISVIYKSSKRLTEFGIPRAAKIAASPHSAMLAFQLLCCFSLTVAFVSAQESVGTSNGSDNRQRHVGNELLSSENEWFTSVAENKMPGIPLHPQADQFNKNTANTNNQSISTGNAVLPIVEKNDHQASTATPATERSQVEKPTGVMILDKQSHDPRDKDLVKAVVTAFEVASMRGELTRFPIDVHCNHGIIQLDGIATSPNQRTKLIQIAKNVPGVDAVFDSISVLTDSQKKALALAILIDPKDVPIGSNDEKGSPVKGVSGNVANLTSSRRVRPRTSGADANKTGKENKQTVASDSDPHIPLEMQDRRTDADKKYQLPNLKSNFLTNSGRQFSLLKRLQKGFTSSDSKDDEQTNLSSASSKSSQSNYDNLLRMIAAGETGQNRTISKPKNLGGTIQVVNQEVEIHEQPGAKMSVPKTRRKPIPPEKPLLNDDLIPVDAMIFRRGTPIVKWVGNRSYPTVLHGPDTSRIASTPKRSDLLAPRQPATSDDESEKKDVQSATSEPEAKGNGLPPLLLPPSIGSGKKSLANESQIFATTDSEPSASPTSIPNALTPNTQQAPLLPPMLQPPPALVPPGSPSGGSSPGDSQDPILLNPSPASPNGFNTQNAPAIESIPVPPTAEIDEFAIMPKEEDETDPSQANQGTSGSFKHRLFRGLCDGVCGGFCGCLRQESLSFGTEGTYLAPIGEGTGYLQVTNLITGDSQEAESVAGFAAGQRFWAQLQSNNVGLAAEYWFLGNRLLEFSDYYASPSGFGSQSNYLLDLNVFDLEYFHKFCCCGVNFRASLGARYFELDRVNTLYGSGKVGDVLLNSTARSSYQSNGFGATVAVAGCIPLRCCGCENDGRGLNLFWQLRGSVLDTDATLQAKTEVYAIPVNGTQTTANSVDEVHATWEGATSNGMLQLGLSYQWLIPKCNALGNVYLGFEGQLWQTAPVGVTSTSQAFLEQTGSDPFGASIVTTAESNLDDLGFAGFVWGFALYH